MSDESPTTQQLLACIDSAPTDRLRGRAPNPRLIIDARPEVLALFSSLQLNVEALAELQRTLGDGLEEDGFYRFYHHSHKVFKLQRATLLIRDVLQGLAPERRLNAWFLRIVRDGTGKTFETAHNRRWLEETRPIIEAYFHARFFLDLAVRCATELTHPPRVMPPRWAALLYLYELR